MSYESRTTDGCALHGRCVTCPFAECYRDLGRTHAGTFVHAVLVYRTRAEHGGTYAEIAERTGLTRRQVEYANTVLKEAGYA